MSYCTKCGCETTGMATCPVCNTPVESGFDDAYAVGSQTVAAGSSYGSGAIGEPIPTFVGAFARFWKKYTDGKSRASRTEFWYVTIWQTIICTPLALGFVGSAISNAGVGVSSDPQLGEPGPIGYACGIIFLIYAVASLMPFLNLITRRLHDFNASGWWILVYIFSNAALKGLSNLPHIIIGCIPPTNGTNQYGPQPRPRR